jgi:recombination protein RecA
MPNAFVDETKVRAPQGWPTGIKQIDDYLIWNGIPKGALSLFTGKLGQGATSAWVEAAMNVISHGKWAAWVSGDAQLFPIPLKQKKIDLTKMLGVECPQDAEKLLWLLQELMSSTIFDLIGCDLGEVTLREHQLNKLKTQARAVQTSLVILSQNPRSRKSSLYSLILNFKKSEILIERALHRPTPQSISRRLSYAQFTRHSSSPIDIGIIKPVALSHPPATEQDSGSET